jgi:uncharacterized membrane protein YfcA
MIYLSLIILFILGMITVIMNAALGGGGGLVLVPLLILLFGLSANAAVATSFLTYTVGAFVAAFAYSRQGRVDYRAGLMLSAFTLPGVIAGAFITASLSASLFNMILGTVTCIMSIPLFLRRQVTRESGRPKSGWVRSIVDSSDTGFSYAINRKIAIPGAVVTGFFSGIFGAGGGLILTPMMVLAGFPIHVALATTRIIALVLSLGGTVTRFSLGQIQLDLALWLCLGAVAGGFVGARLARLASNKILTRAVALSVLVLGLVLVAQSLLG